MGAFDAVTLSWEGRDHTIPANRVLGAIARIEDVVTLEELSRYGERGTMPLAKLAMAYGAVLRYAGANVKDDEVFTGMFSDGQKQSDLVTALMSLLTMMLPPGSIEENGGNPGEATPNPPQGARLAAAASSRRPTKRRSEPAG
jgi:hypothetical protein